MKKIISLAFFLSFSSNVLKEVKRLGKEFDFTARMPEGWLAEGSKTK